MVEDEEAWAALVADEAARAALVADVEAELVAQLANPRLAPDAFLLRAPRTQRLKPHQ